VTRGYKGHCSPERAGATDFSRKGLNGLADWCFARQRRRHRYSVWRILREIADPIELVPPYGAWLWRLKSDLKT
jgi:hypothetical protein